MNDDRHAKYPSKGIPDKMHSKCKGPEVELSRSVRGRKTQRVWLECGERGRTWHEMSTDVMRWSKPSVPGWTDPRANGQNLDGTLLLVGDDNSAECNS